MNKLLGFIGTFIVGVVVGMFSLATLQAACPDMMIDTFKAIKKNL